METAPARRVREAVEQPHEVVAVARVARVREGHELGLGARALEEARPRVDDLDRDLAPADVVEPVARQLS